MLPIPFPPDPPGYWMLKVAAGHWRCTSDVNEAKRNCTDRGLEEHPPLSVLTKSRPSIIFASEQLLADDTFPTYLALPLYTYKGTMGPQLVEELDYAFHVPGHNEPCTLTSGFGNFGQIFPFKRKWLEPANAQKFTTLEHPNNPICRLSEAMMQHIVDKYAAYLATLAGFPQNDSGSPASPQG